MKHFAHFIPSFDINLYSTQSFNPLLSKFDRLLYIHYHLVILFSIESRTGFYYYLLQKDILFLSSKSFYYKTDIYCKAALADLMKLEVFHDWLYPMWESDTYEWNVEVRSVIDILYCQFKVFLELRFGLLSQFTIYNISLRNIFKRTKSKI